MLKSGRASIVAAAASCALAAPAAAHGFGQRYDLPLPLSLYLSGAAAAVVLSFVIVGLFAPHVPGLRSYPRIDLAARPHPALLLPLRLASVGLFLLVIIAGLAGNQDPYRNIVPTLVWIIFWVGLATFSAFVGNLWAQINPWRIIFDWADRLCHATTGRGLALNLPYLEALGVWPACALLLAVSWIELVFPSPAVPANIASLALCYSAITWAGMAAFGSRIWTEHGEVFSAFFGLFACFAPTEDGPRGLALRPWTAGLLAARASPSMVAFILLVLSTVLYDGMLTTPEWLDLERALSSLPPHVGALHSILIRTIGLPACWAGFLGAYLGTSAIMGIVAPARPAREWAQGFAFTLVPIAIAYHLAHYLSYLLTQGQYIVPLASDPFGYGWNLFGTAGYRVNIGIVGARFAWYAAVTAIVLGHIIAVWLADMRAHQLLPMHRAAVRAQVPLTALMVVYTFVSLSILSEPIVERRTPARPTEALAAAQTIPAEAVLPEPGTGQLLAIGPGHSASLRLTYRMLGSAFHDGTRTSAADLLYGLMFAWRWSAHDSAQYDPAIDTATAPMRQRLAALRITGTDTVAKSFRVGDISFVRELFVIDIYARVPPEDLEQDAIFAAPWSTLPWHLLVLMEEAVTRNWAAFSQAEAARRHIEWLDLVRSDTLKPRLAALVDEFAREGFRPEILQPLVSADEAYKRWAALAEFYRKHGHFLVTNGPYRLKSWTAQGATLEAFRDLSYPLGVGSYDGYAIPRRGLITRVERKRDGLRLSAEIETVMKFMRDYRLQRRPLPSLDAVTLRRAAPELRYMVLNAESQAVLTGAVHPQDDLTFHVELDDRLLPGRYTVLAEILVNGNAMGAAIERIPVVIRGRS